MTMAAGLCLLLPAGRAANLSSQDQKFIEDAAKGGMMEVHMGNLGLTKGQSQGVKNFSQKLIDDHTKANNELSKLAQQKGVTLPPENHSDVPSSLTSKSGADFDRTFAKMAVEDHEKDIMEFEKEANSGADPDIKSWASKTLPVLRSHLDAAKALAQ
jgi:putative membrane protein